MEILVSLVAVPVLALPFWYSYQNPDLADHALGIYVAAILIVAVILAAFLVGWGIATTRAMFLFPFNGSEDLKEVHDAIDATPQWVTWVWRISVCGFVYVFALINYDRFFIAPLKALRAKQAREKEKGDT